MKSEQFKWTDIEGWQGGFPGTLADTAQLVLVFGSRQLLEQRQCFDEITSAYPNATLIGCSASGEIYDTQVNENSLSATAIRFDKTAVSTVCVENKDFDNSFEAGKKIAGMLAGDSLCHVFVLSTLTGVNGSELVRGMTQSLPSKVALTGGIASNYDFIGNTVVVSSGIPNNNIAAAIGFYGDQLSIGYASYGGWDVFGPERLVTKSHGNTLYELDDKSALEIYKKYLGIHADGLPAAALYFPLSLRSPDGNVGVVRAVMEVNEEDQSLVSGGDIPVGYYARMMLANYDHLVGAASTAAKNSCQAIKPNEPDLAIVVSCAARKMVLRQRVEEEPEAIREIIGNKPIITGFYSHGEIAPIAPGTSCEFHNQSITITTLREK